MRHYDILRAVCAVLVLVFTTTILTVSPAAYAIDDGNAPTPAIETVPHDIAGRVITLKQGRPVPYDAVCLDKVAAATVITESRARIDVCRADCAMKIADLDARRRLENSERDAKIGKLQKQIDIDFDDFSSKLRSMSTQIEEERRRSSRVGLWATISGVGGVVIGVVVTSLVR